MDEDDQELKEMLFKVVDETTTYWWEHQQGSQEEAVTEALFPMIKSIIAANQKLKRELEDAQAAYAEIAEEFLEEEIDLDISSWVDDDDEEAELMELDEFPKED